MATNWILRRGEKRAGFHYETPDGREVRSREALARIDSLRIPPAWRDVHIAASPRAAIQAWGFDVRGRKQYRYHDRAVQKGQLRKYYRVRQMARDLPGIRAAVERDFRRRGLTRERVAAGVLRLIGAGFFRVGSERYVKENKTFGITTMLKSHVRLEGDAITFTYRGKRAIRHRQVVVDRAAAAFVRELQRTRGARLFRYQTADGWRDLTAGDVNDYLQGLTGFPYTAKDFRTWGGTLRAATVLAEIGPAGSTREATRNVVTTVRLVAAELGNTPTICRKSYVHPVIIEKYLEDGITIAPLLARGAGRNAGHRGSAGHEPEERALIAFLDRHFPERRRRRRLEEAAA